MSFLNVMIYKLKHIGSIKILSLVPFLSMHLFIYHIKIYISAETFRSILLHAFIYLFMTFIYLESHQWTLYLQVLLSTVSITIIIHCGFCFGWTTLLPLILFLPLTLYTITTVSYFSFHYLFKKYIYIYISLFL